MRQRDRGTSTDSDSYGLLFGAGDTAGDPDPAGEAEHADDSFFDQPDAVEYPHDAEDGASRPSPRPRQTRVDRNRQARKRKGGRVFAIAATLVVVMLGLVTWLVVLPIYHSFNSDDDYSGDGYGTVRITVQANDGASDIAATLHGAGVIASDQAFVDAANANSKSRGIQPGTYVLHEHMSGKDALDLILTPSSRERDDVLVTEGATSFDIMKRLEAKPCSSTTKSTTICGPGFSAAEVQKAFTDVSALGLPTDFTAGGKAPSSVEGFLYPATYFFPETSTPTDALNQMIAQFAEQVRSSDFIARAQADGLTPYQQLVVASIAQSEANNADDMKKVARTILNRLAAKMPLQSDATSAYGAKVLGKDPTKVIYSQLDSPYNSYTHPGLPPTPISNPGSDALTAAAHPTAGNWIYFVTKDAQGHLLFTNSYAVFQQAVKVCQKNHWCG